MSARGPEGNHGERSLFSPAAQVVLAGIAAATVTATASSVRQHALGHSGFRHEQGRIIDETSNVSVARGESVVQNARKGSSAVQRELGVVSERAQDVVMDVRGKGKPGKFADGGSRVSESGDYGMDGGVRNATSRNSDKVEGAKKMKGESRDGDVSRPLVDKVLAEIGDFSEVASLSGDELRVVVGDAVKAALKHKDPMSVAVKNADKKVPKLDAISAKNHSGVLNGLKMFMKEGVHYKADEKGFVTLTSSGVALIYEMKIDIFPGRLEALIGENLDAFRLGRKMMEVRRMAKDRLAEASAVGKKMRGEKRSQDRDLLVENEMAHFDDVVDGVEAGSISYEDAEIEAAIEKERDAFGADFEQRMKEDQKVGDEKYVKWVECTVNPDGASGAWQEGAAGFEANEPDQAIGDGDKEFATLVEAYLAEHGVSDAVLKEKNPISKPMAVKRQRRSGSMPMAQSAEA